MYYYPLASGYWKFYGKPLDAFWCCTGTGVEEFSKLNDSIYFHDEDGLFVNLYAASKLSWPEKGLRLTQETRFPDQQGTTLRFETDRPVALTLRLRVPWWAKSGGSVRLNGASVPAFASPSSYLTLSRTWKTGDRVELSLPMGLSSEPMPDDASVRALLYGPLVLAGRLGAQGLTRDKTYGGYDCGLTGDPVPVAGIQADPKQPLGWVETEPGNALAFRTKGQKQNLPLSPVCRVFGERYAVYWKVEEQRS